MSGSAGRDRAAAQARARTAWADLGGRLATVTPAALGRAILTVAVVATVVGLVAGTWPALLPFAIGGLLVYAVIPVVDGLDRIMPRALAAALAMLGVLAAIAAVLVIVIPPLAGAVIDLSAQIPRAEDIDRLLTDALAGLPAATQDVVRPILLAVADVANEGLAGASGSLRDLVPAVLQAALGVAGAVLGLIVLPAWLLTVSTSNRRGRSVVDGHVAGWLRGDFWAVVRMLDRAAGTYLRGFVVVAALIGVLAWLGLTASAKVGGPEFPGALALSVFAGAVQVVPELGPLLGFLPAVLLLAYDPERAAVYTLVYLGARWLGGSVLGGRLLEDRLRVHRAILIPGVVVLSQVGPIALLLSAPILAFGTDLVRYLHGRLSEPPRPAGILPGESAPVAAATVVNRPRVPSVYRGRAGAIARRGRTAPVASPPSPAATR